jgi:hypothetical protein
LKIFGRTSNEKILDNKILDIGCGPAKVENSWGAGIFQYPEVSQILDLNNVLWNLPANHVIEHVTSMPEFMNEVHCIAKNRATV